MDRNSAGVCSNWICSSGLKSFHCCSAVIFLFICSSWFFTLWTLWSVLLNLQLCTTERTMDTWRSRWFAVMDQYSHPQSARHYIQDSKRLMWSLLTLLCATVMVILQCCWNGSFADFLKFLRRYCSVWCPLTTSSDREGRTHLLPPADTQLHTRLLQRQHCLYQYCCKLLF